MTIDYLGEFVIASSPPNGPLPEPTPTPAPQPTTEPLRVYLPLVQ
jgi:hypothetical protein